jgi:hypothetical protein
MRWGVSYLGSYSPRHLKADLRDIRRSGFDDVIMALQENDFYYLKGKINFTPAIAHDLGLRVFANFWGFACSFGGGKISKLLTEHPEIWVVGSDGKPMGRGCPNQKLFRDRVKGMVDLCIEAGFDGFFWDEPSRIHCFCKACRDIFKARYGHELTPETTRHVDKFRLWSMVDHVRSMSRYVKKQNPRLITSVCVKPSHEATWESIVKIKDLDIFGTDPYWIAFNKSVEWQTEPGQKTIDLCRRYKKTSNLWLQAWQVPSNRENEVGQAVKALADLHPDTLWVWAYRGQEGTSESCANPELVWKTITREIRRVKKIGLKKEYHE